MSTFELKFLTMSLTIQSEVVIAAKLERCSIRLVLCIRYYISSLKQAVNVNKVFLAHSVWSVSGSRKR